MKRNEKNEQMKQKILHHAIQEFNRNGYENTSIISISNAAEISKGIIYHYFENKDELYIACLTNCFTSLVAYLKTNLEVLESGLYECLVQYFSIRKTYLQSNPQFHQLFYQGLVLPPSHLNEEIKTLRVSFDEVSKRYLEKLFETYPLKKGVSVQDVADLIEICQNGIYIKVHKDNKGFQEDLYEEESLQILGLIMYGVVKE